MAWAQPHQKAKKVFPSAPSCYWALHFWGLKHQWWHAWHFLPVHQQKCSFWTIVHWLRKIQIPAKRMHDALPTQSQWGISNRVAEELEDSLVSQYHNWMSVLINYSLILPSQQQEKSGSSLLLPRLLIGYGIILPSWLIFPLHQELQLLDACSYVMRFEIRAFFPTLSLFQTVEGNW